MTKLHAPWSNGTQYMHWEERNCMRCSHYDYDDADKCPVSDTILVAMAEHRPWTEADDKAIGYPRDGKPHYSWDCPSRSPIRDTATDKYKRPMEDCPGQLMFEEVQS